MKIQQLPKNGKLNSHELLRFNEYAWKQAKLLEYLCSHKELRKKPAKAEWERRKNQLIIACKAISQFHKRAKKNFYFSRKKWDDAYIELMKFYEMIFDKNIEAFKNAARLFWKQFKIGDKDDRCHPATPNNMKLIQNCGLREYKRFKVIGDGVPNRCYDNAIHYANSGCAQIMGYMVKGGRIYPHSWNYDRKKGIVIEHSPLGKGSIPKYFGVPHSGKDFPDFLKWENLRKS